MSATSLVRLAGADARTNPPASDAATAPTALPRAADRCEQNSALAALACELARSLSIDGRPALVVSAPLEVESAPHPSESVTRTLAELAASALGAGARALPAPSTLSDALHRARGVERLVYLTPTLRRDGVSVVADAYSLPAKFWQRTTRSGPTRLAHALASRPLDDELRALLPRIPLVVSRVQKAALPEREAVALGCGDADGDGSNEIVLVGRRSVWLGRLEHGRFAALGRVAWSDLSKVAGAPLREPIAVAEIRAPGALIVGLTDRADAIAFENGLHVRARWHGLLPWPGGGCSARSPLGLEGQVRDCVARDSKPLPAVALPEEIDALAGAAGNSRVLRLARAVGAKVAVGVDARGRRFELPDSGAALAVGDLDGDGSPEIACSAPTLEPSEDQVRVRTWTGSALVDRFRLPVPTGIQALAVCPPEGAGMAPLVVATGDALWVVQ